MAVKIGAKAEHGFDQPLGLMSDCHRRIEHFLVVLERVLDDANANELSDEQRRAVETALTYFRTAAPRHTQDEECSLFPLLRESQQPQAHGAMQSLHALERDHAAAEVQHAEVEKWFRRLLEIGPLAAPQRRKLGRSLRALKEMYQRHIEIEERKIFPLAGQILTREQLAQVGREMADRRGVSPGAR
jgi:hemerythrin-like domain-containing protein